VSQAVFAAYLNTSLSTVQKWERGQKKAIRCPIRCQVYLMPITIRCQVYLMPIRCPIRCQVYLMPIRCQVYFTGMQTGQRLNAVCRFTFPA
jgi:hypothetical protein